MTKTRYNTIDLLRGLTILSMIGFHLVWDLTYIFGEIDVRDYKNYANYFYLWQQSICWSFIFISGFCWNLGKHQLKRGLIVFSCGLIISLITLIFMPKNPIIFGILSFLGFAMLIALPLQKILAKIPPKIGFYTSLTMFMLLKNIKNGFLGIGNFHIYALPDNLYSDYLTTALGFPFPAFYSADYFPLFPWIFLFFCGYFCYQICHEKNYLHYLKFCEIKPLNICGRHSLSLYLIHQPLIYSTLFFLDEMLDII